ncbi:hypothetical protein C8Q79DRAFT_481000 [Trametes meyenii]|nr:hypothetical protein C8Q79DRAFT_481000 [Trametes meyenii]
MNPSATPIRHMPLTFKNLADSHGPHNWRLCGSMQCTLERVEEREVESCEVVSILHVTQSKHATGRGSERQNETLSPALWEVVFSTCTCQRSRSRDADVLSEGAASLYLVHASDASGPRVAASSPEGVAGLPLASTERVRRRISEDCSGCSATVEDGMDEHNCDRTAAPLWREGVETGESLSRSALERVQEWQKSAQIWQGRRIGRSALSAGVCHWRCRGAARRPSRRRRRAWDRVSCVQASGRGSGGPGSGSGGGSREIGEVPLQAQW